MEVPLKADKENTGQRCDGNIKGLFQELKWSDNNNLFENEPKSSPMYVVYFRRDDYMTYALQIPNGTIQFGGLN